MSRDPRQHVLPGQPLRLAAEQVNALNRMMRPSVEFASGALPHGESAPYTWVYARNATGSDVGRWAVLAITGVEVTPTNSPGGATAQFEQMPVLRVEAISENPTSERCVTTVPIPANKIGMVAVAGAVQIKATDIDKLPEATVLWRDSNWALVRFGGGAAARLGTISATWSKGATATVTQIRANGTAISPNVTFTARNWFATVIVGSGTKKVLCAYVGDQWLLVAAEC